MIDKLTDGVYAARRFSRDWLVPRRWWRRAVVFWQRGVRGWADEDTWSFDDYLDDVIIGGVSLLRKRDIGYPSCLNSMEEWNQILDQIIRGFVAHKMISEMTVWCATKDWEYAHEMDQKLQKEFEMGMVLFGKFYGNLWD